MKKYMMAICLLLVMGVTFVTPMAMSQEEEQAAIAAPEKITGKIVSTNLEDSTLVISYLKAEEGQVFNPEVIIINDATKIMKGTETVGLADLSADSEATVEYTTDANGNKVAVSVTVL